jgi:hypothetical protein
MKIIRHNVFETNSSATHSITINKHTCVYDTLTPYYDGVLLFRGREFSRWSNEAQNVLDKCNYIVTSLFTTKAPWDAIEKLGQFERVVKEHTGATEIVYASNIDQYYVEDYDGEVENLSDEDLKDFLFNPQSNIIIKDRDEGYYYY